MHANPARRRARFRRWGSLGKQRVRLRAPRPIERAEKRKRQLREEQPVLIRHKGPDIAPPDRIDGFVETEAAMDCALAIMPRAGIAAARAWRRAVLRRSRSPYRNQPNA